MEKKAKTHLTVLHQDAKKDIIRMGKGMLKSVFSSPQPEDMKNAYLAISKEQGETQHRIFIENECTYIVDFGTYFGLSTMYFAVAMHITGRKVINTEILDSKATKAMENFEKAGVSDLIDIRIGNALETLKNNNQTIDFLFLDGWKDLYLPLLKQLEPNFKSGTLVYADNMNFESAKPYADYILNQTNKYQNQIVDKGRGFLSTIF